jgi:hypothetical protein
MICASPNSMGERRVGNWVREANAYMMCSSDKLGLGKRWVGWERCAYLHECSSDMGWGGGSGLGEGGMRGIRAATLGGRVGRGQRGNLWGERDLPVHAGPLRETPGCVGHGQ